VVMSAALDRARVRSNSCKPIKSSARRPRGLLHRKSGGAAKTAMGLLLLLAPMSSQAIARVKGYPYWAPPAASNLGQLIPRFRASGIPGQRLIHRRNYANCRNSFPYAMIGPAKSTRRNYVHDLRRLDAATECGFCPQCRIRFIAELATRRVARESGLANRGDHNRDGQGAVSPTWRASAGSSRGSAHLRFRSRMLTRINCLRCMPSFSA